MSKALSRTESQSGEKSKSGCEATIGDTKASTPIRFPIPRDFLNTSDQHHGRNKDPTFTFQAHDSLPSKANVIDLFSDIDSNILFTANRKRVASSALSLLRPTKRVHFEKRKHNEQQETFNHSELQSLRHLVIEAMEHLEEILDRLEKLETSTIVLDQNCEMELDSNNVQIANISTHDSSTKKNGPKEKIWDATTSSDSAAFLPQVNKTFTAGFNNNQLLQNEPLALSWRSKGKQKEEPSKELVECGKSLTHPTSNIVQTENLGMSNTLNEIVKA